MNFILHSPLLRIILYSYAVGQVFGTRLYIPQSQGLGFISPTAPSEVELLFVFLLRNSCLCLSPSLCKDLSLKKQIKREHSIFWLDPLTTWCQANGLVVSQFGFVFCSLNLASHKDKV